MGTTPTSDRPNLNTIAREWDALVETARGIEGLEDFFGRPDIGRLQGAAADGPVVIVNCSTWRCDALILTGREVLTVPLPGLSFDAAAEGATALLDALRDFDRALDCLSGPIDETADARLGAKRDLEATRRVIDARAIATDQLAKLQVWMWRAIAEPILAQLGYLDTPARGETWPRIWWCPTGPLVFLPLHAAEEGPSGAAVIDRVISSYTPTVTALLESRRERLATTDDDRFLVISIDDATLPPLAGAADERSFIAGRLPSDRLSSLDASTGARDTIRAELGQHSWVHFACHAYQDITEPFAGGFIVGDGTLTLEQVASDRFSGEFAGLAACQTATGGWALADESISLAAALHRCGYRHVVGTLWSISDAASAEMFSGLYGILLGDGTMEATNCGETMHHVIREMRSTRRSDPLDWAPFVHFGPS